MTSKLKSYPETRFNYAYDMLKSIYDNHGEVYEVLAAKQQATNKELCDKITCLPIDEIKHFCDFLLFFKNVTTTLEGENMVTMHRVWPAIRELWLVLKPKETDTVFVKKMKSAGLEYITKPNVEKYFQPTNRHKLALFLHPLMNRLPFLTYRGKYKLSKGCIIFAL